MRWCIVQPLKPTVFVVDNVITREVSFAAAKHLLADLLGVQVVVCFLLAKTVHPPDLPVTIFRLDAPL